VAAGDQPDNGVSRFDAYRRYADSALFLSGVFPAPPPRRKPARAARAPHAAPVPSIDGAYYVSTGKAMYRMAAGEREAGAKSQPETLTRLAEFFEVYASALAEMSERYILGADRTLIADKMLDAFNAYRRSGDAQRLDGMRRYAEILHVDPRRFRQPTSPLRRRVCDLPGAGRSLALRQITASPHRTQPRPLPSGRFGMARHTQPDGSRRRPINRTTSGALYDDAPATWSCRSCRDCPRGQKSSPSAAPRSPSASARPRESIGCSVTSSTTRMPTAILRSCRR
jgi:hypothetical protein